MSLTIEDFRANTKEWFLEQLSDMPTTEALKTIKDLCKEHHKLAYPKTYDECCEILKFYWTKPSIIGYKGDRSFR